MNILNNGRFGIPAACVGSMKFCIRKTVFAISLILNGTLSNTVREVLVLFQGIVLRLLFRLSTSRKENNSEKN